TRPSTCTSATTLAPPARDRPPTWRPSTAWARLTSRWASSSRPRRTTAPPAPPTRTTLPPWRLSTGCRGPSTDAAHAAFPVGGPVAGLHSPHATQGDAAGAGRAAAPRRAGGGAGAAGPRGPARGAGGPVRRRERQGRRRLRGHPAPGLAVLIPGDPAVPRGHRAARPDHAAGGRELHGLRRPARLRAGGPGRAGPRGQRARGHPLRRPVRVPGRRGRLEDLPGRR